MTGLIWTELSAFAMTLAAERGEFVTALSGGRVPCAELVEGERDGLETRRDQMPAASFATVTARLDEAPAGS
jgi:hypothetical protein